MSTTRRSFLTAGAGAAAAAAFAPRRLLPKATSLPVSPRPDEFPRGIPIGRHRFRNWSGEIVVDRVWTCWPENATQVVAVANWAQRRGYRLRATGSRHGWSPLVLPAQHAAPRTVLLDTSRLNAVSVDVSARTVTAQAGVAMEELLSALQKAGLGFAAFPAPGDVTFGGVLAIGGHGSVVPANGERRLPGQTYGSVSNLVHEIQAVVWDERLRSYVARTFERHDGQCASLLVHLGRSFVTAATVQAAPNQRLRCQSFVDVPASELFAAPGTSGRTFASYLDSAGRVESIWFPFTESPWLKVWTVAPSKPAGARAVSSPYNYPFADYVTRPGSRALREMLASYPEETPRCCAGEMSAVVEGLRATRSADIWGWSRDVLLYVRPTTLRVSANGYAIHTRRDNVQRVIFDFVTKYNALIASYQGAGQYPVNSPLEIRLTGLDRAEDIGYDASAEARLSATREWPREDWDVAVWIDVLTMPGTPAASAFYCELEQWAYRRYDGTDAAVRPEWSKGWAYTSDGGGWSNTAVFSKIRRSYGSGWRAAMRDLDEMDPGHIFGNAFLDRLLV